MVRGEECRFLPNPAGPRPAGLRPAGRVEPCGAGWVVGGASPSVQWRLKVMFSCRWPWREHAAMAGDGGRVWRGGVGWACGDAGWEDVYRRSWEEGMLSVAWHHSGPALRWGCRETGMGGRVRRGEASGARERADL